MNQPHYTITPPSGFAFDAAAAATHVVQSPHTRGVTSSRGLEEGTTGFAPQKTALGITLSFNTDGFVAALNAALANNNAGYVMQLQIHRK